MHSIPQRCARRPLAGGLVVPWVSLVPGGHAAFGSLHAERALAAFLRRLCQICGQPLNERCYLIVQPADAVQDCSPEPALHPECLPYTAAHCPMLNGTVTHYRRRPVLTGHPAGRPAPTRPADAPPAPPTKATPRAAAAPPTGTRPG
ncbi:MULTISPECIES: hypothetical protein [unclassified Streptomyces]|uniref:hypothetical protein n=1 Tax=unclassified Streptomyces TaxID=2593676 RepID=UPI001E475766|nr:hypothetical protein [Streptomyces sp. TRM75561]MCC9690225.1 hypothetical protein [Streptomyces sp. MNU103]MDH3038719.1 hypothetical protein [Streptomyces sp. TRM75561]